MKLYHQQKKNIFKIVLLLILINFLVSAWPIIVNKNITFHTDIARDFLLMEEITATKKPTLIGPRAGGIPGVFHGPLWLYLNLPAFILGDGNPILIGYFWIFLAILAVFLFYISTKNIFNKQIAIFATLLYSAIISRHIPSLFNTFGALIFTPLFFLLFVDYLKTKKIKSLSLCLFFLGILVQFQVGYGGVLVFLTSLFLFFTIIKEKRYFHLTSFLFLLIPLSSFLLFELRHNFFQIRSVISYFQNKQIAGEMIFSDWFFGRLKGLFFDGINLVPQNPFWNLPITIFLIILFIKILKNKKLKYRNTYLYFYFFYLGFWFVMFFYKGIIWGFFYWGFLPLMVMIFSSFYEVFDKKIFLALFVIIYCLNSYSGFLIAKNFRGQWQLYYQMAKKIFKNSQEREFGYYVYSPDLYGYSGRYAFSYVQKEYFHKKAISYEKRRETFLLIEPPPDDKPWLNSVWWVKNQVNINKKPAKVFYFDQYRIEKYLLNYQETKIPADPNLIKDMHFR
mgnify:CR=1 FL=1